MIYKVQWIIESNGSDLKSYAYLCEQKKSCLMKTFLKDVFL
jgi:hypothetical protein